MWGQAEMSITKRVEELLAGLPEGVEVVAAAKTRTPDEVLEAVKAGIGIVGENYLNDAERVVEVVGRQANWHFIGRLQRNKVKRIVGLFDMIETIDSVEMAELVNKQSALQVKRMDVLIEVNSGCEPHKTGVMPDMLVTVIEQISSLVNIRVMGLMTMGPQMESSEGYRPYFRLTRQLFERIARLGIPGVQMRYLSMGMTDSYRVAIEEGANIIRIGTMIFGPRN